MTTPTDGMSEGLSALQDDRLRFFLENHQLIGQWAALADEVFAAVSEELGRLGAVVQEAAAARGIELAVADRVAGGSPMGPMLHRPAWRSPDTDGPDVAVGLGWDGKVLPAGHWPGARPPYAGILASRTSESGPRIEAAVRPVSVSELVSSKRYQKGIYWVVYRFIPADDDWYSDVPRWQTSVVDQLLRTWDECVPVIDRGLESLSDVTS